MKFNSTSDLFGRLPKQLLLIPLALAFVLAFSPAALAAGSKASLDGLELISALRQGGYNVYFRHEATDWSQSDNIDKADDWLSCDSSRIRQLSNAGRNSARATGKAIRKLGIPFGKALASPYCRTIETARLMGFDSVEPSTDVMNMRVASYFGGRAAIVATAQALLSTLPAAGTNTLIVAHGNVAQAATPVYPGEGEGLVFKPDGMGGFSFVGRLKPADWVRLSQHR